MPWLDTVANIAQILGVIGPLIVFGYMVVRKIDKKLDAIEAQQRPNGGTSLRDAIDRVDEKITDVDERLTLVEQNLANLRGAWREHTRRSDEQ